MTAKKFQEDLRALVNQAFKESPCPLSQMIVELSVAQAKCLGIQMQIDAEKEAHEIARSIIPANGSKKITAIDFK